MCRAAGTVLRLEHPKGRPQAGLRFFHVLDLCGVTVIIITAGFEIRKFADGIHFGVDVFAVVEGSNMDSASTVIVFSDGTVHHEERIEVDDVPVDYFSVSASSGSRDTGVFFASDDHCSFLTVRIG